MSGSEALNDLTVLLQGAAAGDQSAAAQILPLVYGELRRLAAAKMAHEAAGRTLQPTALVHEAWLRLGGDAQPLWESRAHFFAAAAEAMRRILIEGARRRRAARRGGGAAPLDIDTPELAIAAAEPDQEVLLVHDALAALEQIDARKAELVKQHYFVGLEFKEIAEIFGVSERTVLRDWKFARAWLFDHIKSQQP